MQEIGSEFWNIPETTQPNKCFPKYTQWFLSGRSALQSVIKELKNCHTIAMPSWCCDSMIKPFVDAGIEVCFYPVYWKDGVVQSLNLDCDVLFIVDYFGYTGIQPNLIGYKGVVIRDVTHSIFSSTYSDADFYFGSLRKWCGIWTGGFAWTKDGHQLTMEHSDDFGFAKLRKVAMQKKEAYINMQLCEEPKNTTDKSYLKLFEEAEEILEKVHIGPASERDINAAKYIDVRAVSKKRRENAEVLRNAFPDWLMFSKMNTSDCPLFVPIIVPNEKRNELRQFLIENSIYCPVHWPISKYHKLNEQELFIYRNELSLVCDQRYNKDDMNKIVRKIRLFMEGA